MRKLGGPLTRLAGGDSFGRIIGVLLLLFILSLITPSQPVAAQQLTQPGATREPIKVSQLALLVKIGGTPNFQLTLNGQDMGKASDPSRLATRLSDEFRRRQEQGIYKYDGTEIEKTVTVKSDRAIKYGDFVRVIKAIKDAGAKPVVLATDEQKVPLDPNARPQARRRDEPTDEAAEEQTPTQPTPREEPKVAVVSELVTLSPGATALVERVIQNQRINPDAVKPPAAVLEVRKDGEYYLGGKRVEKAAIYQELLNRFKTGDNQDKVTYIVASGDLGYGSVEDAINEVWEASHQLILVTAPPQPPTATVTPTNWLAIILAAFGGVVLLGVLVVALTMRRR